MKKRKKRSRKASSAKAQSSKFYTARMKRLKLSKKVKNSSRPNWISDVFNKSRLA